MKNILAVVQSIVMRTLADERSPREARDILVERLHALGRVHEHLIHTDWRGAPIREIIRAELEPFSARVQLDGPELVVDGKMVQTLALVLHELATNAAKYGSLSGEKGTVSITWSVQGSDAKSRLRFKWEERDGPTVKSPLRKGFGTALLESAITADPDVKPCLSYEPNGFVYEFEAPLDAIVRAEWSH